MQGRIDYQKEKYNALAHSNLILRKITEFNATESTLIITDAVTFISGFGTAGLMLMASAGIFSYLIIGAAFYFGKDPISGRDQYRKNFLEQLSELVEIYQWCEKTGDKNITYDETFLTLLATIAHFVEDGKNLIVKDRQHSLMFKKILSQSPHHIQFLVEKKTETYTSSSSFGLISSNISSLFFTPEPPPKPPAEITTKPINQPEWIIDIKRHCYKQQTKVEVKPQEKKHESADMLANAVTFVNSFRR